MLNINFGCGNGKDSNESKFIKIMKKLLVIASTIAVSIVSLPVLAQSRFVDVSNRGSLETFLLDTRSIKGNRFELVQQNGDGFIVVAYQVNCQRQVSVTLTIKVYDRNQKVLAYSDDPSAPERYDADSPIGRSAAIVCRNN